MKKFLFIISTLFLSFLFFSCSGGGGTSTTTTTSTTSTTSEITTSESIIKDITTSSIIQDNCNIQIKSYAEDNSSNPVSDASIVLALNKNGIEKVYEKTTDDTGYATFNVDVCTLSVSSQNINTSNIIQLTYTVYPKGFPDIKSESPAPIPLDNTGGIDLNNIVSTYEIKIDNSSENSVTFLILPYNKYHQLIKNQLLNFNIFINDKKINITQQSDDNGRIYYTYQLDTNEDINVKIDSDIKYEIFSSNSIVVPVKDNKIDESSIADKLVFSYDTNTLPDNTTINILALNKFNAPAQNINLYVQASCGLISSDKVVTDEKGEATILFTNLNCNNSSTITVTTDSGVSSSYIIPITSESELIPSNIIVLSGPDGENITQDNKSIEYTIKILDKDNNPVSGTLVSLSSSCGKISSNNIFSDNSGEINFYFYPDSSCLFGDNITLTLKTENEIEKNITLHLESNIAKLNIQPSKTSVLFGINDNLTITLFAIKEDNTPAQNELIKVTTNCGILYSNTLTTDEKGEAILQMNSICDNDSYDKLSLTFSTGNGDTFTTDIPISYENVVESISISSSKLTVIANGSDTALITVFALNKNNGPVSNVALNVSSNIGFVSSTNLQTDSSGKAQFTFSAGTYKGNDSAIISITASKFNKILSDNITIEIQGVSLTVNSDKQFIKSDGADYATITIYVKDPSNNPEYNFPVNVYLNDTDKTKANLFFNNNEVENDNLTANTDINGKVEVQLYGLQPGEVTLFVESGGTKKELTFFLSNEVFQINDIDNINVEDINDIEINKFHKIHFVWKDENGNGVNDNITFATNLGFFTPVLANGSCDNNSDNKSTIITSVTNGDAYVCYRSDYVGTSTITAIAKDKSTSYNILNVSKNPVSKIILNASRTIIPYSTDTIKNTSTIIALVLDKDNNPLANKQVAFSLLNTSGSGEEISPNICYTDASGRAYATFTSGQESVDNLTVKVEADNVTQYLTLTVAGKAVNITLGKGDKIYSESDDTIYKKPLTVLVTDSTGNPINGAVVNLKVYPTSYTTGTVAVATDSNGQEYLLIIDNKTYANEDVNFNNILDPGEDLNGNGKLDPVNPVALDPGNEILTDEDGFKVFYIKYAKCYAHWLKVKIIATTDVNGSKSEAELEMSLPYSQDDYEALTVPCKSPYGP